jgi:hypothetical protein
MGRRKLPVRPPPRPVAHDAALLEAVRGALTALSAGRKEATPPAIEEWIKVHQHDLWSSIPTASALKGAIEAVKQEEVPSHPVSPTKETNGMGRKKKVEKKIDQREPPAEQAARPEPAATRNGNGGASSPPLRGRRGRPRRENAPASPPPPSKPRPAVPRPAAPRLTASTDYDPTRSDLLRVLAIVRQESSVSKLQKLVQTVKHLADQVGGLDRLAVCLDTLEEFGIK